MKKALHILSLILLFVVTTQNLWAQWTNLQAAEYVIGQPDFTTYTFSYTALDKVNSTDQVAIDLINNKIYIIDNSNNRVLRFAYPVTQNGPTAEMYFGGVSTLSVTANNIFRCYGVAVHNGTLWISDTWRHRILKFTNAHLFTDNSPNADGVLGQLNFTSAVIAATQSGLYYPFDITIDQSGNMWVADQSNNRVLKFNDVNHKANGATADLVIGQPNFTSNTHTLTQSGLYMPWGVAVLGSTVWVADYGNDRVLRFDNPIANGFSAAQVLGQTDFTTNVSGSGANNFSGVWDLALDPSGRLYVSDQSNGRIMIFNNAAAKGNGAVADNVLGQPTLSTYGTDKGGQNNFYYSYFYDEMMGYGETFRQVGPITVDSINNKLIVSDLSNSRVLIFSANSTLPVELTFFTASITGSAVALKWHTATEVNNYGFEIERRAWKSEQQTVNGWQKIGFVQGAGTSNAPKEYSYSDATASSGSYVYRLKQINVDGSFKYSQSIEVTAKAPEQYTLGHNFPNPFNPSTTIKYGLPSRSTVQLVVYNVLGQVIADLVNTEQQAGIQSVVWNATVSSGLYFYQLEATSLDNPSKRFVETKKMILLK